MQNNHGHMSKSRETSDSGPSLHCAFLFALPLPAPELEEGVEPQQGQAGKSVDGTLHSPLMLCRKQFPSILMVAVHPLGNSEGELDRLKGSCKL